MQATSAPQSTAHKLEDYVPSVQQKDANHPLLIEADRFHFDWVDVLETNDRERSGSSGNFTAKLFNLLHVNGHARKLRN